MKYEDGKKSSLICGQRTASGYALPDSFTRPLATIFGCDGMQDGPLPPQT